MIIFITGVAGFLGSHLADKCLKEGHTVIGVDNMSGGYRENVPEGVIFHEADCLDQEAMRLLIKGVDVVYHCACTAYEGLSVFSPHYITQNTYGITTSVLSAAIHNKVKRFVFCSSMARYGSQATPFMETMTPQPQDPYGIAKYASELTIANLCTTHGIEYVIAVPHNIIGPRQKYDDPYRNVASIMMNRMLQNKPAVIYGDGTQRRCFSFVSDVVDPLYLMSQLPLSGEVINIGPDDHFVSINQLSEIVAEMTSFKGSPIYFPDRPQEVRYATCCADKARKLLNYCPQVSLHSGLKEMVEWIKEKGVKDFDYHIGIEIDSDLTPKTWTEKKI